MFWLIPLVISLPILFSTILIIVIILVWKNKYSSNLISQGRVLCYLDLKNQSVFPLKWKSNKVKNKKIFKGNSLGRWIPLKDFLDIFVKVNKVEIMKKAFNEAEREDDVVLKFSVDEIFKKKNINFTLRITKIDESDQHIMNFSWDQEKIDVKKIAKKNLTLKDIWQNASPFKGFLAFSLDYRITNVEDHFLRRLTKILKFKEDKLSNINEVKLNSNFLIFSKSNDETNPVKILFINGMVLIPIFGKNRKVVSKKIKKFTKVISKREEKFGMSELYLGSSQLISEKIDNDKKIKENLMMLDFLINLSIRTRKQFISNANREYKQSEFLDFSNSLNVFQSAIKNHSIETTFIPIKNYKTKKEVRSLAMPTIKNISKENLKMITRNKYYNSLLKDIYALVVCIENEISQLLFLEANLNWVLRNKHKVAHTNMIYILKVNSEITNNMIKTISDLSNDGFVFAFKIKKYSEQILTSIIKLNPKFIILDKSLSFDDSPEKIIELILIRKMIESKKVQVIFENPPMNIDEKWIKKIGIKFFYNIDT